MKKIIYIAGLLFLSTSVFGMQQEGDGQQREIDQDNHAFQRLTRALRPEDKVVKCFVCQETIDNISPEILNQCRSLPEIKNHLRLLNLEDCDSCAVVFHAECLRKAKEDPAFRLDPAGCAHPELFKWRSLWLTKRMLQERILSSTMQHTTLSFAARHSRQKECVDLMCGTDAECVECCSLVPNAATYIIGGMAFIALGSVIVAMALELGDRIKGRRGYSKNWEILAATVLMYFALNIQPFWL